MELRNMERRNFLKRIVAWSVGLLAVGKFATKSMAATQRPAGLVPVGGVVAWLLSLTGIPALPDEFVQCNGQTLSDPQSVFDGTVIPNLNGASSGTKRFLRGSSTSGTTGGSETHTHTLSTVLVSVTAATAVAKSPTDATSTLPSYYEVVWVMRIK